MIKFFRKIRQQLLAENKVSRYLLYAIGEIVLVVIGILIALQINNYNEYRKDGVKERKVLIELKKTLKRNCETMRNDLEIRNTWNWSSEIIISALQNKHSYDDSLNVHFQHARIPGALLTLSNAGYEDLKNTGFNIIRSDSIRNEIIDLFEVTYSSMAELNNYFLSFQAERQSYIDRLFFYNDKKVPLTLVPFDYKQLLSDNHFLAMLISVKVQRDVITREIKNSFEESQRTLRLINTELKESD